MSEQRNLDPHTRDSIAYGDRQSEKGHTMMTTVGLFGLASLALLGVKSCSENSQFNQETCAEIRSQAQDPSSPDLSFIADNGVVVYCNPRPLE